MRWSRALVATGIFVSSLSSTPAAFANGQGSPIEPAPETQQPVVLEPAGPAPAETVKKSSEGTNWWLIGLGAAAVVGLVILFADDDEDDTNG